MICGRGRTDLFRFFLWDPYEFLIFTFIIWLDFLENWRYLSSFFLDTFGGKWDEIVNINSSIFEWLISLEEKRKIDYVMEKFFFHIICLVELFIVIFSVFWEVICQNWKWGAQEGIGEKKDLLGVHLEVCFWRGNLFETPYFVLRNWSRFWFSSWSSL